MSPAVIRPTATFLMAFALACAPALGMKVSTTAGATAGMGTGMGMGTAMAGATPGAEATAGMAGDVTRGVATGPTVGVVAEATRGAAAGVRAGSSSLAVSLAVSLDASPIVSPVVSLVVSPGVYQAPADGPVARFFDPPAQPWLPGHRGVDFHLEVGATVVSPGGGVVTFAGSVAGKPVVVVSHPDGLRSSLEPVAASVGLGATVSKGQAIGMLTVTPGGASNPEHCAAIGAGPNCLHWGVRRAEVYLDPLLLLGQAPPIVLLPY